MAELERGRRKDKNCQPFMAFMAALLKEISRGFTAQRLRNPGLDDSTVNVDSRNWDVRTNAIFPNGWLQILADLCILC